MSTNKSGRDWTTLPKLTEGGDFKVLCNDVAANLEAEAAGLEAREREYAATQRELQSRTYFVAVRHILGRPDPIELQTCEPLPIVGHMRSTGRDYDHALSNLWLGIAHQLMKKQQCETWEDARGMAVDRYSFIPSMADSIKLA